MFNILNGDAVGEYLSRTRLEMHGMKENIAKKQCFGSVFRIRIQIQEGKDDPQK
jgi:hypothetical protein